MHWKKIRPVVVKMSAKVNNFYLAIVSNDVLFKNCWLWLIYALLQYFVHAILFYSIKESFSAKIASLFSVPL